MIKTKLFLFTTSLILACIGFLSGKPQKKFSTLSARLRFIGSGGSSVSFNITTVHFTTIAGTHSTVGLVTLSGCTLLATLLTNTVGVNKIYYK